MLRSLTLGKLATATMLLALPLSTTGCQSTGGWGWSPPSLSSLNPWKSSATNSQLASSKPSSVPTPPATMMAGSGLARNSSGTSGGAPTYNANTYGGTRPTKGYNASTGDYGIGQVSATQGEGYPTGRYNTGSSTAQQGPYGSGAAPGYGGSTAGAPTYGGAAAATADRRSDPAYGSGTNNGWQGYNNQSQSSQPSQPQNNPYQGAANGAASGQTNPYATGPSSSYAGATGLSSGASRSTAPAGTYGGDAYRPGSTARGSDDVQRASYDNRDSAPSSYEGYPTTAAGDDSTYR